MNTYFFIRVRLGQECGKRSFSYGPYSCYEDAEHLIQHIPDLIECAGAPRGANHFICIDERYMAEDHKWKRIRTRIKITVNNNRITSESGD